MLSLSALRHVPRILLFFLLAWECEAAQPVKEEPTKFPMTSLQSLQCTRSIPDVSKRPYPNSALLSLNDLGAGIYDTLATRSLITALVAPLSTFFKTPTLAGNVHVIYDGEYDAFSTQDGNVYVTLGALLKARSDQEVTALIAHEVGHLRCGHPSTTSVALTARWIKLLSMLSGAAVESRVAMVGAVIGPDDAAKYSQAGLAREHEVQADLMAVDAQYAATASYGGSVAYLSRINDSAAVPEGFSALSGPDHPTVAMRRDFIRDYVRHFYPANGDLAAPSSDLLDAWRNADRVNRAAYARIVTAATLLSLPMGVVNASSGFENHEHTHQAQQKLQDALALYDQAGAADLAEFKRFWLVRWVSEELQARARLTVSQLNSWDDLQALLDDPRMPEWFVNYTALVAMQAKLYIRAADMLHAAQPHYANVTRGYPLHIAALRGAELERGEAHSFALAALVSKCGVRLESHLNEDCRRAYEQPYDFMSDALSHFTHDLGTVSE